MRTLRFQYAGKRYIADVTALEAEQDGPDIRASVRTSLREEGIEPDDRTNAPEAWFPVLRIPAQGPTFADPEEAALNGRYLLDLLLPYIRDSHDISDACKTLAPFFGEFWQQTVEEIRDVSRSRCVPFEIGNLDSRPRYVIRVTAGDVQRYDSRWIEGTLTMELSDRDALKPGQRVLSRLVSHISVPATSEIAGGIRWDPADIGHDALMELLFGPDREDDLRPVTRVTPRFRDISVQVGLAIVDTVRAGLPEGE